ncbi:hypothetical protein WN51_13578 [Melipona quadrifasciata]|uniref:Uncharacterized protein n=1 Tax=Melipona quadrifasciata TaxID=166423 RepID=A0A0M8ZZQ8_9HYME|nr:hypothetical protein WN51_13578 [Melipona quadrifasciata]
MERGRQESSFWGLLSLDERRNRVNKAKVAREERFEARLVLSRSRNLYFIINFRINIVEGLKGDIEFQF